MGKVVLVGAGPGDEGLLTIKGEKYIKQADCLIYDRLGASYFLNKTKPSCELIYVGKENHKHVMKQDDINELLYKKAEEYKMVVRLKGGDPYVFGRGGEEALYLKERDIDVEVVPGVSSSVAALSTAGIPITHRGIAKGFQVITAHSRKDEPADIDYSLLTDETVTCVFLMGLAHVKNIAAGLMGAGRRHDTPVAVISNGTLPIQKKCVGTLADIGNKIESANLISPAIIVVGDVVSLNEKLSFFEKSPLFGRHIVAGYIKPQTELISKLTQLGADVTGICTGEIETIAVLDFTAKLENADIILFTSKNGVQAFFDNLERTDLDIRSLATVKFGVVGEKTNQELNKYHIKADIIADVHTGEGLGIKTADYIKKNKLQDANIAIFKAKEASEDLVRTLNNELKDSVKIECIDSYENVLNKTDVDFSKLKDTYEYVFTSASNVRRLYDEVRFDVKKIKAYSIGPKTSQMLEQLGVSDIIQAKDCSYDSLIETIIQN